jgi:ATP synthase protein I
MFSGNRCSGNRSVRVRVRTTVIQHVAVAQAALAVLGGLAGTAFYGIAAGWGVLFGASTGLAVSLVLWWRERQSMRHPEWDQHRLFKLFIRVGLERLAVLVGLLILGLGTLKLAALPVLFGLVLAQLGWLAAVIRTPA